MGKIFYIIGKSSTGKDTIYSRIRNNEELNLQPIVLYTTRPIRSGETEGVQYHFTDEAGYESLNAEGHVIESRVYHTAHGDWRYFTADDGNIDTNNNSYIVIGVLESYVSFMKYYGSDIVVPIYIDVDDGERLMRALQRELLPENRKFVEMCRRFIADTDDFSEEKIQAAGITDKDRFCNDNLESCIAKITDYIKTNL